MKNFAAFETTLEALEALVAQYAEIAGRADAVQTNVVVQTDGELCATVVQAYRDNYGKIVQANVVVRTDDAALRKRVRKLEAELSALRRQVEIAEERADALATAINEAERAFRECERIRTGAELYRRTFNFRKGR